MSTTSKAANKLARNRYLRQIWKERRTAIPALTLTGVGTIFTAYIPPLIIARVLANFGGHKPTLAQILPYVLLFGGAWLLGELIWRIAFLFINHAETNILRNLYNEGLEELVRKDIGFFHNNFAGSLTKKTLGYARSMENFLDTIAFQISPNVIPLIFAVFVLWRFSPWLVVVLIGMLLVTMAVIIPFTKRRARLVSAREVASNHLAGHVADVIGNIDAVQAIDHEPAELTAHARNVRDYTTKALRSWDYHTTHIDLLISPLYVTINSVGLAIAVVMGTDAASLAAIFITFSYYTSATRLLWEFNQVYRRIESSITEGAQFTELLLDPPALNEVEQPINLKMPKGEVAFQDVDFAYKNSEDLLFEGLNLLIAPGEKIALVGHSGGGKTTITKLLLRFTDLNGGQILIDGQDIAQARLRDLRHGIAYVPQEPAMFHRTIADNIRYGKPNATDEEVLAAAKKAHADEFVAKLPQGYQTMVGERGVKLSGGQRQRIAIARALIKDARILVLDEATSALDSESEKLIQAALWQLMEGRTAIVIAHRLSTIQKMDRIIVLDNGRIIEQGSHAELLAHSGTYAKLWAHQSGGFIEE